MAMTAQNDSPNRWNLVERVGAGYFMNTIDMGKWKLMAGLRLEDTNTDRENRVTLYPAGSKNCPTASGCGTPVPVKGSHSYIDPLGITCATRCRPIPTSAPSTPRVSRAPIPTS